MFLIDDFHIFISDQWQKLKTKIQSTTFFTIYAYANQTLQ